MPARAADLDTALQKKGGLNLSQLANYDDLITDALVDRVSRRISCLPFNCALPSLNHSHMSFHRSTSGPKSAS